MERNDAVLRALRRSPSLPRGLLWRVLRGRPGGFKFRRQHPLERCVVDFYCPAAGVVIEIDGESHSMGSNPARDAARDDWLRRQGLRVLRFTATEVMRDLESVVTQIVVECRTVPPHRKMGRGTTRRVVEG